VLQNGVQYEAKLTDCRLCAGVDERFDSLAVDLGIHVEHVHASEAALEGASTCGLRSMLIELTLLACFPSHFPCSRERLLA
jgi:hypothetical protein